MKTKLKNCLLLFGGVALFGSGIIFEKRRKISRISYCGSLRIDQSEEDDLPKLFLELEKPIHDLKKLKIAMFRIHNQNYISAK